MDKKRGYGVEALPLAVLDIDAPFCPHGMLIILLVAA